MSHISFFLNQLKSYNTSLIKKALFVDKPWTLVDEDGEIQKLIFKTDHSLIISKNGNVKIGNWEYLSGARSLVIDRDGDIIMCNECFVDDAALILKSENLPFFN